MAWAVISNPGTVILFENKLDLTRVNLLKKELLYHCDTVPHIGVIHIQHVGIFITHRENASGRHANYRQSLPYSLTKNLRVMLSVASGLVPQSIGDHRDSAALLVNQFHAKPDRIHHLDESLPDLRMLEFCRASMEKRDLF